MVKRMWHERWHRVREHWHRVGVALVAFSGALLVDGGPAVAQEPVARPGLSQRVFLPRVSRAIVRWPTPTPLQPTALPPTPPPAATPDLCAPIPDVDYDDLSVNGGRTDRPAAAHPDLNLALRGWERTDAPLRLVDYGGGTDPRAPRLSGLLPGTAGGSGAISSAWRVYDWLWPDNRRGGLMGDWPVTMAGLPSAPGQPVYLPPAGYSIGSGYQALVLYATTERVTLKYTREDNVVYGYTIHLESVCVEPSLRALYERRDRDGRGSLPALHAGEPLGRARGGEIFVAVRDSGRFMDPRSRKDWW
jgi:hypothetical protein